MMLSLLALSIPTLCRYVECDVLFLVMLTVIMLSVVMPSAIMLIVVALCKLVTSDLGLPKGAPYIASLI